VLTENQTNSKIRASVNLGSYQQFLDSSVGRAVDC